MFFFLRIFNKIIKLFSIRIRYLFLSIIRIFLESKFEHIKVSIIITSVVFLLIVGFKYNFDLNFDIWTNIDGLTRPNEQSVIKCMLFSLNKNIFKIFWANFFFI